MKENREIIEEYFDFRIKSDRVTESTAHMQKAMLIKFARDINKPFKEIKEKDILDYLSPYKHSSRNTILAMLKKFYRWVYNLDDKDPLPDNIRRIKQTSIRRMRKEGKQIKERERLISDEEFHKIRDQASDIQHKALIELLYYSGARISELLSMKATDVEDSGNLIKITVRESKTQPRDILIKESLQYVLEWYNVYQPFKGQKDKPLWASRFTKKNGNSITREAVLQFIKRYAKEAGITKKITNHDFRHTAISRDLENGMPTSLAEVKYGLVHGSSQIKTYDHNGTKELEKFLLQQPIERPETHNALKRKADEERELRETEIKDLKDKINLLELQKQTFQQDAENQLKQLQDQMKTFETLTKRLIADDINPFDEPDLTPEEERIEEEIESQILKKHNVEIEKQYKEELLKGNDVGIANIEGKLFLYNKTQEYKKIHNLIFTVTDPKTSQEEKKKAKEELQRMKFGQSIPTTPEEEYLLNELSKFEELKKYKTGKQHRKAKNLTATTE